MPEFLVILPTKFDGANALRQQVVILHDGKKTVTARNLVPQTMPPGAEADLLSGSAPRPFRVPGVPPQICTDCPIIDSMTPITRFSSPADAEIHTASGASPLRPARVIACSMIASISASELTSPKYPQADPNEPSPS